MAHRYTCLAALPLALLSGRLCAQDVIIYQNSFVTPNVATVLASCQEDFAVNPVNDLWAGTSTGTSSGTFQQTATVETILINGPADIYDDPAGNNGDFCLGMLHRQLGDVLALLVDGQQFPFINISMDMSAINSTCGGPFPMAAPAFRVEAIDAPGGVFDFINGIPIDSDTLFGTDPNTDSFVFNWATDHGSLDISNSTDGQVGIRFTLLASSYAAFDNIYIEASQDVVITGIHEHNFDTMHVWPNPSMDLLNIAALPATVRNVTAQTVTGGTAIVLAVHSGGWVDISDMAPGLYVLRIQDGDQLWNARFVKE